MSGGESAETRLECAHNHSVTRVVALWYWLQFRRGRFGRNNRDLKRDVERLDLWSTIAAGIFESDRQKSHVVDQKYTAGQAFIPGWDGSEPSHMTTQL